MSETNKKGPQSVQGEVIKIEDENFWLRTPDGREVNIEKGLNEATTEFPMQNLMRESHQVQVLRQQHPKRGLEILAVVNKTTGEVWPEKDPRQATFQGQMKTALLTLMPMNVLMLCLPVINWLIGLRCLVMVIQVCRTKTIIGKTMIVVLAALVGSIVIPELIFKMQGIGLLVFLLEGATIAWIAGFWAARTWSYRNYLHDREAAERQYLASPV